MGQFAGFMTFQNNTEEKDFCLLQSVIRPDKNTDELYSQMDQKVIEQNVHKFPAIMTTDPKSKFEPYRDIARANDWRHAYAHLDCARYRVWTVPLFAEAGA